VPTDLSEGVDLAALQADGLTLSLPVLVVWLGVSMYVDPTACRSLLSQLARLAPGSRIVFDYILPPRLRDWAGRDYAAAVAGFAGRSGEPWVCSAAPEEIATWLYEAGWQPAVDVAEAEVAPSGFWPRSDALKPMTLVRLVEARIPEC